MVETLLFGFRWRVLRWVRRDKRLLLGDRPSTRCLDSRPLLTLLPLPLLLLTSTTSTMPLLKPTTHTSTTASKLLLPCHC